MKFKNEIWWFLNYNEIWKQYENLRRFFESRGYRAISTFGINHLSLTRWIKSILNKIISTSSKSSDQATSGQTTTIHFKQSSKQSTSNKAIKSTLNKAKKLEASSSSNESESAHLYDFDYCRNWRTSQVASYLGFHLIHHHHFHYLGHLQELRHQLLSLQFVLHLLLEELLVLVHLLLRFR